MNYRCAKIFCLLVACNAVAAFAHESGSRTNVRTSVIGDNQLRKVPLPIKQEETGQTATSNQALGALVDQSLLRKKGKKCSNDCDCNDDDKYCKKGKCTEKKKKGTKCKSNRKCKSGCCFDREDGEKPKCAEKKACHGECVEHEDHMCTSDKYCFEGSCKEKKEDSEECNQDRKCISGCCGSSGECLSSGECDHVAATSVPQGNTARLIGLLSVALFAPEEETYSSNEELHSENQNLGCDKCDEDGDCDDDEYCLEGKCTDKKKDGESCNDERKCLSGCCFDRKDGEKATCAADGVCNGQCEGHNDDMCTIYEYCYQGSCKEKKRDNNSCSEDRKCMSGCCSAGGKCLPSGECDHLVSRSFLDVKTKDFPCGDQGLGCGPCEQDDDCDDDEYCLQGDCVDKKGENETCNDDRKCASGCCFDREDGEKSKCASQGACNGQCEGHNDSMCTIDKYCYKGSCKEKKREGKSCSEDRKCLSGCCSSGGSCLASGECDHLFSILR